MDNKVILENEAFINETSLSRVGSLTKDRNIGMITAHRATYTKQENDARNNSLETDLRAAGHGFVKVKGRYIENYGKDDAKTVDENSILVIGRNGQDSGHLKGSLLKLGKKYDQDSVLIKPHDEETAYLHGTNETGWPGLGKKTSVGNWHPGRVGEFHSLLRGKKTFSFESVNEDKNLQDVNFVIGKSFFCRKEREF